MSKVGASNDSSEFQAYIVFESARLDISTFSCVYKREMDMGKRAVRKPESKSGNRLLKILETLKRHPLIVILGVLVAVAASFTTVLDMTERVKPIISNAIDPYHAQKEAVNSLQLQQTVDFVNSNLGQPEVSEDLCKVTATCTNGEQSRMLLNIYRDEQYTIRAVFDENSLDFFAVTLQSEKFKPQIHWLDYDLGALGTVTYQQAYDPVDGVVEPTAQIFFGPQTTAYAEVFAAGAPAQYQGLMLGWAPDGFGNLPWDLAGGNRSTPRSWFPAMGRRHSK